VQFRDVRWFGLNINHSTNTIRLFQKLEDENLHIYAKPNTGFELINVKDPRIFVFLRQQVERSEYTAHLDELLVDTLIFLALDDTDPDKDILRTKSEILTLIAGFSKFDTKWLDGTVTKRLAVLSTKPLRKIKHHRKIDQYCLPYETRQEWTERQVSDWKLYQEFSQTTETMLIKELSLQNIAVNEPFKLLEKTIQNLFYQQGLEFSQFVSTGDGSNAIDKSLRNLIAEVVDKSSVVPAKRPGTTAALLNTLRNIIYRGSTAQLEFPRKLADTYRMLFLLQIDPQLAKYFEVMAGKLHIYVDTSILIPAMSEYFLDEKINGIVSC
jgi:hypothetical protein